MATKKNATPDAISTNGTADVPAPAPDDSGVKPAPYDAAWINVNAVAKIADVSTQTVRNAYREHAAFNPVVDGATKPAWFTTKMVDAFGNATDYDVVYIDRAAVDVWIAARAAKGTGTGTPHGGAKRRIIRLTQDQIDALPVNDTGNPFITLADGTAIVVEAPPMGTHKPKSKTDAAAIPAEVPPADDAGAGLFDVELAEAPAA